MWLLAPALRRFGYAEEADRITDSCIELVARHGFREYYNPHTGHGMAASDFGFSTLLLDLLAQTAQLPGGPSAPGRMMAP